MIRSIGLTAAAPARPVGIFAASRRRLRQRPAPPRGLQGGRRRELGRGAGPLRPPPTPLGRPPALRPRGPLLFATTTATLATTTGTHRDFASSSVARAATIVAGAEHSATTAGASGRPDGQAHHLAGVHDARVERALHGPHHGELGGLVVLQLGKTRTADAVLGLIEPLNSATRSCTMRLMR